VRRERERLTRVSTQLWESELQLGKRRPTGERREDGNATTNTPKSLSKLPALLV
jgi:hypothetical protein